MDACSESASPITASTSAATHMDEGCNGRVEKRAGRGKFKILFLTVEEETQQHAQERLAHNHTDYTKNTATMESMGDYEEPAQMPYTFCARISQHEFERQSRSYTAESLTSLVDEIKKRPELYALVVDHRLDAHGAGICVLLRSGVLMSMRVICWGTWPRRSSTYGASAPSM